MTQAFAFFDVDDTLIRIKSMFDFYRFWSLEWHANAAMFDQFEASFEQLRRKGTTREDLNRSYYRHFAGIEALELERAGIMWAKDRLAAPEKLFVTSSLSRLKHLKEAGVEPVFVSGSFSAVLKPLASYVDVAYSLNTRMSVAPDGLLTGEIEAPQTIGEGKATAIRQFLSEHSTDPRLCYAFGDDISDLPMLMTVGNPAVVGQGLALAAHAREQDWEILAAD